jgi:hypothetical protein
MLYLKFRDFQEIFLTNRFSQKQRHFIVFGAGGAGIDRLNHRLEPVFIDFSKDFLAAGVELRGAKLPECREIGRHIDNRGWLVFDRDGRLLRWHNISGSRR